MSTKSFWARTALGLFLAVGLAAWSLSQWHLNAYIKEVGERLVLLMELRKGAIEQYFSTAQAELIFWSTNSDIVVAQEELNTLWADGTLSHISKDIRASYIDNNPAPDALSDLDDAGDGTLYSALHSRLHPLTKLFVSERGYYDVFLIGTGGDVYYTVEKETDFGSNLMSGPWRDSGLGEVYRRAMESANGDVVISDMQAYGPSGGAPAIFMARSIENSNGTVIGVIAFQLPTGKILEIMAYTSGMGDTGETYLVGQDKLMRSNSRFATEATVLVQEVDSVAARKALAGNSGLAFLTDYRGVDVMSAYTNLEVGETSWAVIAEFDRAEIVASAAAERPSLKGTLLFIYGLSLWSVWYWRGSKLDTDIAGGVADLDMGDFGDTADFSGS